MRTLIGAVFVCVGILLTFVAIRSTTPRIRSQWEPVTQKDTDLGTTKSQKEDPQPTASKPLPVFQSKALAAFLERFDEIKSRGFIKTQRSGSTGIGYTLESLLGLKENNDRGGDFLGMEIKAYRDSEAELDDSEKMNLFLKEPKWLDNLRTADRIRKYGYVDKNGRSAWYSTVTFQENSHGLRFEIDEPNSRLFLVYHDEHIAVWDFGILQQRLKEKHTEAVFVAAETRGAGKDEEFHYHTVTWCHQPSVTALVELIGTRDVMLELRMHVKENGSARNHGTAFRIHKNKLNQLFATTVRYR
ncbi:MAG: MvaI/BcnI family restriction endonuclease [Planctomycetaceae bacterium]